MSLKSLSPLLSCLGLLTVMSSCSLTETRQVLITSTPSGATAYVNEQYAGETPIVREVPNRKRLTIYLDKDGYMPVDKEIHPAEGFWGWVLWGGMNDKGLSLPKDNFHYDLDKMQPGERKPIKTFTPPKAASSSLRRISLPD